jgi:hypothetical protein
MKKKLQKVLLYILLIVVLFFFGAFLYLTVSVIAGYNDIVTTLDEKAIKSTNNEDELELALRGEVSPGNALVGVWSETTDLSVKNANHYQFFSSGKYNYRISDNECSNRNRGHSGTWSYDGATLVLTPQVSERIIGGKLVFANEPCVSEKTLENGVRQTVPYTQQVKEFRLPVSYCAEITSRSFCRIIRGTSYYRISNTPEHSLLAEEPTF